MNIALIKTGALGDVVRTTSLVPALRRQHGPVAITWITSAAALALVSGLDSVTAVLIDDPPDAAWRRVRYDWIISLDDDRGSCETATALDGARRSGAFIETEGERAYTSDVAAWFGMGILRPSALGGLASANTLKRANTRTYGELLYEGLGLSPPVAPPVVVVPESARRAAAAWIATALPAEVPNDRTLVGLNTGAAGRWQFKSWGIDASATLARRLAGVGWTVVVLGGAAEANRNLTICERAAHPRVVAGPTTFALLEFAALIAACATLVCSDSLAMHLAVAAGVPVIALFGPTSDAEIDLFGRGEKVVAHVPCTRCYLPTCDVKPNCMETITPQMVQARIAPARALLRAELRGSQPCRSNRNGKRRNDGEASSRLRSPVAPG
jgi:heptosyltransferase-2